MILVLDLLLQREGSRGDRGGSVGRVRESDASVLGYWVGAGLFQLIAPVPRSQDRGFRSFSRQAALPENLAVLPAGH